MADAGDDGYRWEGGYEKTWEAIQEDEGGLVEPSIQAIIQRSRRDQVLARSGNVRLGMMRHLMLILDASEQMKDQDLVPDRYICSIRILEKLVSEFFDQNPISQLGLIIMRNKRAELRGNLSGNPQELLRVLSQLSTERGSLVGEASLQNALELAAASLKHMPAHTSREVLVVTGSLSFCDPGDLKVTVQAMRDLKIRCSVIGLAAEVRVTKVLCRETGGDYNVVLNDQHFLTLVMNQLQPPTQRQGSASSSLVKMGFPNACDRQAICSCHLTATSTGYFCPQCDSKFCQIPTECTSCGLTLVSASHLARSYRHLFPLELFQEVSGHGGKCNGCRRDLGKGSRYLCPKCRVEFCCECDLFLHDSLHACPECLSRPVAK